MNPSQPALIQAAAERLPSGGVARIGTDSDEEGTRFAAVIEAVTVDAGKGELAVDRVTPPETKDWNDVLLRAGGRHSSCVLQRALSTHC
ncbi:MAG: toprim domain-containing protein [Chromatiaceae bacterium]|jgi:hypothetical protein|nr:toprim domain-containing protein [Chromatiaceae bacterium]